MEQFWQPCADLTAMSFQKFVFVVAFSFALIQSVMTRKLIINWSEELVSLEPGAENSGAEVKVSLERSGGILISLVKRLVNLNRDLKSSASGYGRFRKLHQRIRIPRTQRPICRSRFNIIYNVHKATLLPEKLQMEAARCYLNVMHVFFPRNGTGNGSSVAKTTAFFFATTRKVDGDGTVW